VDWEGILARTALVGKEEISCFRGEMRRENRAIDNAGAQIRQGNWASHKPHRQHMVGLRPGVLSEL